MSGEHSGVIQIENILILSVLKIFSELLVMRGKSKSPAQCQHNTYFRICGGGAENEAFQCSQARDLSAA